MTVDERSSHPYHPLDVSAALRRHLGPRRQYLGVMDELWRALRGVVVVLQFGETAAGANGVDVTLGEDGAQPGLHRAAAVKIAKQGSFDAFFFRESVEIGKKGVRKIVRGGRTCGATQDSDRRRAQGDCPAVGGACRGPGAVRQ